MICTCGVSGLNMTGHMALWLYTWLVDATSLGFLPSERCLSLLLLAHHVANVAWNRVLSLNGISKLLSSLLELFLSCRSWKSIWLSSCMNASNLLIHTSDTSLVFYLNVDRISTFMISSLLALSVHLVLRGTSIHSIVHNAILNCTLSVVHERIILLTCTLPRWPITFVSLGILVHIRILLATGLRHNASSNNT